jgi:hypothetical protein
MEWWKLMQPSWRRNEANLPLFRDVPNGETWQALRKGGTAGVYVVVTTLSWWIKAQHVEGDVSAWSTVDDLSWVLQQMKGNVAASVSPSKKRAHEGDNEG